MNKIYKVIWSKVKNCYVVASEIAKSHTKSPKSGILNYTLVAGVLACVLSCGAVLPVFADVPTGFVLTSDSSASWFRGNGIVTDEDLFITGWTANGSTGLTHAGSMDSQIVFWSSPGYAATQPDSPTSFMNVSLDGAFYQHEGQYRVLDIGNVVGDGNKSLYVNNVTGDFGVKYYGVNSTGGTNIDGSGAVGPDAIAIGKDANASTVFSLALGRNASTALAGTNSDPTSLTNYPSMAIGAFSKSGVDGVALGTMSEARSNASTALGEQAIANKGYSVALGSTSYADEENVVSVGHKAGDVAQYSYYDGSTNYVPYDTDLYRRVVNVADGVNAHDATTVGQLKSYVTPASNGTFINTTNTGGQNLTALDTASKNAVKSVTVDGNMLIYTKGDNSSVSVALPTGSGSGGGVTVPNGVARTTTVGSVTAFASNSTPSGYLLCDGRAVSRTEYAALFQKIGTTYGAGDGVTTFNLPNLVNRFVEGSNASGQYINAGLPNITGTIREQEPTSGSYDANFTDADTFPTTGAFGAEHEQRRNYNHNSGLTDQGGNTVLSGITFDASKSNSIYGNSDTVQPNSLKMQYYIKTNDEAPTSRYVGINSDSGYLNEWGDGATGADAIAIGKNAAAETAGGVAIGNNAHIYATQDNGAGQNLAIGDSAVSYGGMAIGQHTQVGTFDNRGDNSVAVGTGTKVYGKNSVGLGINALIDGYLSRATALGTDAHVTANNAVALGAGSVASANNIVSVGHTANDTNISGTAYGSALQRRIVNVADGVDDTDVATIGQLNNRTAYYGTNAVWEEWDENNRDIIEEKYGVTTEEEYNTLKANSNFYGDGATGTDSIAIGKLTTAGGQQTVAIGNNAHTTDANSIAIGNNAVSNTGVAIGVNAKSTSSGQVAIGRNANISVANGTNNVIAIGNDTNNLSLYGGTYTTIGINSIALGSGAVSVGARSYALGNDAVTPFADSVAIGDRSVSQAVNTVSFGHKATDLNYAGNAYGSDLLRRVTNVADGIDDSDVATVGQLNDRTKFVSIDGIDTDGNYLGDGADGVNSIAIGSDSSTGSEAVNSVAIGKNSSVTAENAIALGSDSIADIENTVSVGSSDATRRIVNVTDGITETDAATVGQIRTVSAGNGVILTETDNTNGSKNEAISVKAGNNVIVNENGVNVDGTGIVSSGNTGLISGGTAYTELRPANGNYIRQSNTTAANLTALDTKIGSASSADGTYINAGNTVNVNLKALDTGLIYETINRETEDTNLSNRIGRIPSNRNYIKNSDDKNISENLILLDDQVKTNEVDIANEVVNRTDADTELSNRIGTLSTDGNYIFADNNVSQNLSALDTKIGTAESADGTYTEAGNTVNENLKVLDTQVKVNTDGLTQEVTDRQIAITNEATARQNADTVLSDRIGTVSEDKNYIKKSDTNNVSENLIALDSQLKTTTTNLNREVTNRVNAISAEQTARESADAALSDRIGTLSSDGNYIRVSNNVLGNVNALDSKIGSAESADGNYTKTINTVNENIKVLDTYVKSLNDNLDDINNDVQDKLDLKANKDASNITDSQAWADKLGNGTVSEFDTKLITGATVAGETRIDSDGNYVLKNNTAGQNITALDVQVKANTDAISNFQTNISDELNMKANVDLDNITPAGETVIRDLAKGSVKVINGTSTTVTKGADGNATTYAVNVVKDGVVERNNTGIVTGGTVYNAVNNAVNGLETDLQDELNNKANKDASNVIDSDAWGNAIGTGTVTTDSHRLVTGSTIYDEVRPDNGNYISKNDTTAQNLSNLDTQLKTNTDTINNLQSDLSDRLDSKANADASNVSSHTAEWGQAIGTGTITDGNNELLTGNTVYDELRPSNGNYVTENNTTSENLTVLDTQIKTNADAIDDLQNNVNDGLDGKANKDFDNITPAGEQVVRELAKGSVKVVNGTNTIVTENIDGDAKTYAVNVVTNGVVEDGNTGIVTGGTVKEAIDNLSDSTDDKLLDYAKKDASNITDTEAWGQKLGTGEISDGNTELVTGGTVYTAINNVMDNVNTSLDDKANKDLDNITPAGKTVIRDLAKGSVKVVNGTNTTVIEGTDGDSKTYAVNVLTDGTISEDDEGIVSGKTVYNALQNETTMIQNALEEKANKDASNITDAEAWGEKIAIGEIVANDKRAVSGETVHTAIETVRNEFTNTLDNTLTEYAKRDGSNVDAEVWGEKLGSGTVDSSDNKLVSGKTIANETRVTSDGNYIQQSNSASQNFVEIDRILKETRDIAENAALTGTDDNAVHYDTVDKSVVTLEGTNGTVITNLKDGELSANSKDAVTGKQLFETNEKVKTNTENITALTNRIGTVSNGNYVSNDKTFGENIGALDTQLKTVSDGLDTVRNDMTTLRDTITEDLSGKSDTDLGNITEEGQNVIRNLAKGSVKVKGTGFVTVTSSTEEQATVYTVDVQANGTVEEGDTGLVTGGTVYNSIQDVRNDMNGKLDDKANVDLSNLNDTGREVIREIMSNDLDKKADRSELETKANTDASNIDVQAWNEKLGTGVIEEGNTGLINGDAAFRAIQEVKDNEVVKADFNEGVIRFANEVKYDAIDTINISKSDGSGRVISGIVTDSNDASSAANVGYVNAVGQNIINSVNDGFAKVNDKVGKAGASAAAMASLPTPPMDGDEKWAFSAAVGHYDGETSGAIGAFYKPQDNVIVNVRGAVGNGEDMIGAGVGVALNRGGTTGLTKAKLAKAVNAQANVIVELKAENEAIKQDNMQMRQDNEQMRKDNEQMKQMISAMAQKLDELSAATLNK